MSVAFLAGWRADYQSLALPSASSTSIPAARGTVLLLAKIEAFYGDLAGTDFPDSARNRRFGRRSTRVRALPTIAVAKFSGGVAA